MREVRPFRGAAVESKLRFAVQLLIFLLLWASLLNTP